ncbi:right-handed parallel beta-helix repeat-containing protein [Elongatibacter sediminis]|uniref:Right-handed parallel beta-helix repeat-containing protein n=1 Tax=Elongatibacter sediminis TaxID=3119006 RepID=A0AAW9RP31_9GAMM
MNRSDRIRSISMSLALSVILTNSALAETFVVDSLNDFSDDNIGDGKCETLFGNPVDGFYFLCSLRGAIEESNALAGKDTIQFSVAGTISPSSNPLPLIAESVVIDGSSAPGAPARDRELDSTAPISPPPAVFIDGAGLGGSSQGLILGTGARGSEIYTLGITNFPGAGLRLGVGAGPEQTIISGCWIGQAANRTAAANATGIDLGFIVGTVTVRIGHDGSSLAGTGRGNVISGNLGNGIEGNVRGVTVRGNWIGSDGNGGLYSGGLDPTASVVGNGGIGVSLIGSGNGVFDNQVIGNGDPQVMVQGANLEVSDNQIFGAIVPTPLIGPTVPVVTPGPGDGLHVLGENALVQDNQVLANQTGIRLDADGGSPNTGGTVAGNVLALNAGDGIVLAGVQGLALDENSMFLNGDYGARIQTDSNQIRGNEFGVAISSDSGRGNAVGGVIVTGQSNEIVDTPDDKFNSIIFNEGPGIVVVGDGTRIENARVALNRGAGVMIENADATEITGTFIFNTQVSAFGDGDGIRIGALSQDSQIDTNLFAGNEGASIALDTGSGGGHAAFYNVFFGNEGIPIDLQGDGPTPNDPNDDDSGVNRLQNAPVLSNIVFDDSVNPPTVSVDYTVDTTTDNSTYPLTIEFYVADQPGQAGGVSIHRGTPSLNPLISYPDAPALKTAVLNLPENTEGGIMRALAIDAEGNTSELSAALEFGVIDMVLFRDGFEEEICVPCPIFDPFCICE